MVAVLTGRRTVLVKDVVDINEILDALAEQQRELAALLVTSDQVALTTIRGTAADLCAVAGRRVEPADTALTGQGPDLQAVLELVRTYA